MHQKTKILDKSQVKTSNLVLIPSATIHDKKIHTEIEKVDTFI